MTARWIPLAVILLSACGGTTDDPSTPLSPPAPVPRGPDSATVQVIEDSRGCLRRHNADVEMDYLIGDKQAKTLLWYCAAHDHHANRKVQVFFPYNFEAGCYQQRSTQIDFGLCTNPPPPPRTPVYDVRLSRLVIDPGRNTQNLPGFSYRAVLINEGNIDAFELSFTFAIDGTNGGSQGTVSVVPAGATAETPEFGLYGPELAGQRLFLKFTLRDPYSGLLAARRLVVDVPP